MVTAQECLSEEEMNERFEDMYPIFQYCENRGTPCYYVSSIASIQDGDDLPFGALVGSNSNKEKLSRLLDEYDINTIDISHCSKVSAIPKEELFYITDHHWRLETCFSAYWEIIHTIENETGFENSGACHPENSVNICLGVLTNFLYNANREYFS